MFSSPFAGEFHLIDCKIIVYSLTLLSLFKHKDLFLLGEYDLPSGHVVNTGLMTMFKNALKHSRIMRVEDM